MEIMSSMKFDNLLLLCYFLFCFRHPIIRKLSKLHTVDTELAGLLAEQLFDNAMVSAGVSEDPRSMVSRLNTLLEKVLEKH